MTKKSSKRKLYAVFHGCELWESPYDSLAHAKRDVEDHVIDNGEHPDEYAIYELVSVSVPKEIRIAWDDESND